MSFQRNTYQRFINKYAVIAWCDSTVPIVKWFGIDVAMNELGFISISAALQYLSNKTADLN